MASTVQVMLADGEPQERQALRAELERNEYTVVLCESPAEGLRQVGSPDSDAVILELLRPGLDGLEFCRRIREKSDVPIIVLSDRSREDDIVQVLDSGADDFICKPFTTGELLARIRAVLRRKTHGLTKQSCIFCGALIIDCARRQVRMDGKEIHLTPKEYELLCYLAANPNTVLTHQQLLTKVWGEELGKDRHTLRVHIANLRNKLEQDSKVRFIHTESRIGYRFRAG